MKIFGTHDEPTLIQFEHVRSNAVDAALMADGHVGYVMPIGGVAAYRDQVSVVGVGFDIACGNAAIRTEFGSVLTSEAADSDIPLPRRFSQSARACRGLIALQSEKCCSTSPSRPATTTGIS